MRVSHHTWCRAGDKGACQAILEFVCIQARGVAESYNLVHLFESQEGNLTVPRRAHGGKIGFRIADASYDPTRPKLSQHGPGDRHAIGAAFGVAVRGTSRPGLERLGRIDI
jgi:hypothetical protein